MFGNQPTQLRRCTRIISFTNANDDEFIKRGERFWYHLEAGFKRYRKESQYISKREIPVSVGTGAPPPALRRMVQYNLHLHCCNSVSRSSVSLVG